MAFAFGGALGTAQSKGTGNTVAITTGATAPVGSLVVVCIGVDNVATTDGDHGGVTSVVDSAGNLYLKAGEHTNGQGTAGGGSTVSVWQSALDTQLSSGGTITVTLGSSVGARSAIAGYWTIGKSGVAVAGLVTQATDGADPAALTLADLPLREYLCIGAGSYEGPYGSDSYAADGAFSAIADAGSGAFGIGTTGGGAVTNQSVGAGYRILTGTGASYDATIASNRDSAGLLVALYEVDVVDVTVAATDDDGVYVSNGGFNAAGWTLGNQAGLSKSSFSRFAAVTIPGGAVIASATLVLRYYYTDSKDIDVLVRAADYADPAAPTTGAGALALDRTTAATPVHFSTFVADTTVAVDVTVVVQELVDSYDYSSGAAMLILCDDDNSPTIGDFNEVHFRSRDDGAEMGARLIVAYEVEGGEPETIEGGLAATLAAVTVEAAGETAVSGELGATLAGATLQASGESAVAGALGSALAAVTLQADGELQVTGALAEALSGVALEAAGESAITGALAATIANVGLEATGAVGSAPATGTLATTLGDATVEASGDVLVSGDLLATLGGVTVVAAGESVIAGELDAQTGDVTLIAAGESSITGLFVATLTGVTLAARGGHGLQAVIGAFGAVAGPGRAGTVSSPERAGAVFSPERAGSSVRSR